MAENDLEIYSHLKQSRYLENISEETLREFLTLIHYETFEKGEEVVRQGQEDNDVFFIVDGSVQVKTDGQLLYTLGRRGDIFGEMSVVSSHPSAISVEVQSDLRALSISPKFYESIQQDSSHKLNHIFFSWLSRILADKLYLTTEKAKRFEDISKELSISLQNQKQISDNLAQLTNELSESKYELEQLNRMKNEFIGVASHDLRSPISSVIAVMETLPNSFDLDDEVKELLGTVHSTCHEQLNLVNDLLDVAQIESGKLDLDCSPLSVDELEGYLFQNLEKNRLLAKSKQIELCFDNQSLRSSSMLQPEQLGPLIPLDLPKIQQVVNNLIGNAIKFTPEGGRIDFNAVLGEDGLQVSISDSGIGISSEVQDQLFNKFHQVKDRSLGTKGERGTGLGLAICKNLIELHGGQIWVESEQGQGSCFHFTLPVW